RMAPAAFAPGVAADGDSSEPPNPPYPLKQDLSPDGLQFGAGEEPADPRPRTVHQRFLELGQLVWTVPEGEIPSQLSVAWAGQPVVYMQQQQLMAGQIGAVIQPVDGDPQRAAANAFGMPVAGLMPPGAMQPPATLLRVMGTPTWAGDNRHVLFADAE